MIATNEPKNIYLDIQRQIIQLVIYQSRVLNEKLSELEKFPKYKPLVDEFRKVSNQTAVEISTSEDSNSDLKPVFREIAKNCHSDVITSFDTNEKEKRVEIFRQAVNAYKKNDLETLYALTTLLPEGSVKIKIPEDLLDKVLLKAFEHLQTAHHLSNMQLHEVVIMLEDYINYCKLQSIKTLSFPALPENRPN